MEAKDTVIQGHYSPEEFYRLNKQAESTWPIAKKAGIREAWDILSTHLPINGYGKCFYCGVGSKPDENGYHPDKDNVWNGDRLCWNHESYDEARGLQVKLKIGEC